MKRATIAVLVALLVWVAGCSTGEDASSESASPSVTISMFKFTPESVRVRAGDTARWENTDEVLHTVTAGTPEEPTGAFDGDLDGAGTSFETIIEVPGTYSYFCSRHPFMQAEVVVES